MKLIRQKRVAIGLNMAPMIDCIFQLLIFFMLSSTFSTPLIKLSLPQASSKEMVPYDEIVVTINSEGVIYVNKDIVEKHNLKRHFKNILTDSSKKTVTFRGDKDMPYHLFVEVIDAAKFAGAANINIAHEVEEKK